MEVAVLAGTIFLPNRAPTTGRFVFLIFLGTFALAAVQMFPTVAAIARIVGCKGAVTTGFNP